MIFVTLGSQKFQFDRLLQTLDALIEDGTITDTVFAQTGYSTYVPKHFQTEAFMDRDAFSTMMDKADTVITHAGTGAIIGAVKKGKKTIAVPRLAKYGEHVDDHQTQIVEQFNELNLICGLSDCDELAEKVKKLPQMQFNAYESNTQIYIDDIAAFLQR